MAIERLYEDSQPARRQASEELFELTNQIVKRIEADDYDEDELLHLTESLARTRLAQRELRRRMQELAARTLSPQQRETLSRLVGGST